MSASDGSVDGEATAGGDVDTEQTQSPDESDDAELDASPPASPDGGFVSDKGDGAQRGDVLSAMAVYSGEGQADDASGHDVAQVLMQPDEGAGAEPDPNPHGPH